MNRDQIQTILDEHVAGPLGVDHRYAVLCALIDVDGEEHVLFEKRSSKLTSHTSEVSLPGGRIEEGETPRDAAFRETIEELRIAPSHLEIFGEADYLVTRRNQAVHCFIGAIRGLRPEDIDPSPDEVDYVFSVPLSFFLTSKPEVHVIEFAKTDDRDFPYDLIPSTMEVSFRNVRDHIFFYKDEDAPDKENIVWGMTAKIMYGIARLLRKDL
ncbi:MAG: CoA pyrophosphatase [Peptoniphilus sp.]|nr:CoA pyrophosphatase [Peptoniphilus sp.]MDY6045131.1 CoA pyrophosphatase [Peptoniphilus sp.]